MRKVAVEFTDREYRWSHGKSPRGYGYWAFGFEGHEFWAKGTLTEAKKKCVEEVRRLAPEGYTGPVWVNILP